MKVLKKTSFESFEQLSLLEAAQLYGGNGDGYPTDPPGCDGYSDCGCSPRRENPPATPTAPPSPKPVPQGILDQLKQSGGPTLDFRADFSLKNNGVTGKGTVTYTSTDGAVKITAFISTDGSAGLSSIIKF